VRATPASLAAACRLGHQVGPKLSSLECRVRRLTSPRPARLRGPGSTRRVRTRHRIRRRNPALAQPGSAERLRLHRKLEQASRIGQQRGRRAPSPRAVCSRSPAVAQTSLSYWWKRLPCAPALSLKMFRTSLLRKDVIGRAPTTCERRILHRLRRRRGRKLIAGAGGAAGQKRGAPAQP
jgi:hypothetical protein